MEIRVCVCVCVRERERERVRERERERDSERERERERARRDGESGRGVPGVEGGERALDEKACVRLEGQVEVQQVAGAPRVSRVRRERRAHVLRPARRLLGIRHLGDLWWIRVLLGEIS